MDEDEEIDTVKTFTLAHKLVMFCSPVFIGASHIVFMTLNYQANIMNDNIVQPVSIRKFLKIEQLASFASLLFAITADSYAARYNLMKFAVLFTSVPVFLMAISDVAFEKGLSESVRSFLFLCGVATSSINFVLMPVENAFTSEFIQPNSPLLRKYFFIIHYMSYMWQGLFGILISIPTYISNTKNKEEVTFCAYALQLVLWVSMVIGYAIVLYLRRGEPRNFSFGIGTDATICLYRALWANLVNLVQWTRDQNCEIRGGFDKCSEMFTSELVTTTRKLFKLFIIHFCLMFFHGLELILRTMWYLQDASMYRASFLYAFPLDVILLMFLAVFFPVVEYLVLPIVKRYTRIQLSDLKLVGISTVLFALAYILTMMISMLIMQETTNNPGRDRVTARMYNTLLYPVDWSIKSNHTEFAILHLPSMKSRVYINDVEGLYNMKITTSYFSQEMNLYMKKGDLFNFLMTRNKIVPLESVDKELYNVATIGKADSHVFVIPVLSNWSRVRLDTFKIEFSGLKQNKTFRKWENGIATHIVLHRDHYLVTLSCNTNAVKRRLLLNDFSLHTVLVFDTITAKMNARFEKIRSGSSHNRILALPQVVLAGLAISVGKVSVFMYTYQHAPSNMLSTAFSFHRFAFACSIITFNLVVTQLSLANLGVIGFLVFFFILIFYYVTLQRDLNFDEEDEEILKEKVAKKMETRTEEE